VIIVTPAIENLIIDGVMTAKKDALPDELKYEVVTASEETKRSIPAIEGPLIQTKAKGTIVLYNIGTSSTPQKIIAGTRLSSSKGLTYRTTATVSIPAQKLILGRKVPGTVSVGIIAENAGVEYNISSSFATSTPIEFRIIAYKGSNKYQLFYGRLKTDISGGFSGTKKIISADIRKTTEQDLQNELKRLEEQYRLTRKFPEYGTSEDENVQEVEKFQENFSLQNNFRNLIRDTKKALAKLEKGTHGVCEECKGQIEQGRLKAYPGADLCVTCTSKKFRRR